MFHNLKGLVLAIEQYVLRLQVCVNKVEAVKDCHPTTLVSKLPPHIPDIGGGKKNGIEKVVIRSYMQRS